VLDWLVAALEAVGGWIVAAAQGAGTGIVVVACSVVWFYTLFLLVPFVCITRWRYPNGDSTCTRPSCSKRTGYGA
jgi:hypothetical protein